MKRLALVFVLVLALVSSALAASFTISLTPQQVSAITYAFSVASDRAKFATAQDWFAAQVSGGLIAQYAQAQTEAKAKSFCERFNRKPQAERDAICSSIGASAGCNCQ